MAPSRLLSAAIDSPGQPLTATFDLRPGTSVFASCSVAVTLPPVQTTDEFPHVEAESQELECRLRRGIAPDAVAVADVRPRFVEGLRRFEADLPVRETGCPRDVLTGIRLGRATVNDRYGFALAQSLVEIPGIHFECELVLVVVQLMPNSFDLGRHNPSLLGRDTCDSCRLPLAAVDRHAPHA